MRWTSKPQPKLGEYRFKTRYFIFPHRFGKEWIWLEKVMIQQTLVEATYLQSFFGWTRDVWKTTDIV